MELIFATHNLNKVAELSHKLEGRFEILSLRDINLLEEIPETGNTLEENALIKARHVYSKTNKACFADDTGLEVDALNGAPGVHTARFAGENADNNENIEKLLQKMEGKEVRSACFRTVIAYVDENGEEFVFKGSIKGNVTQRRRGDEGFGYDPVFIPEGFNQTFAELDKGEKNAISHRGRAVVKFVNFLKEREKLS